MPDPPRVANVSVSTAKPTGTVKDMESKVSPANKLTYPETMLVPGANVPKDVGVYGKIKSDDRSDDTLSSHENALAVPVAPMMAIARIPAPRVPRTTAMKSNCLYDIVTTPSIKAFAPRRN